MLLVKKQLGFMSHELGDFAFFEAAPHQLAMAPTDMNLVVMGTDAFNTSLRKSLTDFRANGYVGPSIVLAKSSTIDPLLLIRQVENLVYIEKPYETKDHVGITRKLMKTRKVVQRIHRRYY